MSTDLLGRVLAEARHNGIDHLSFTGGEPTLHPRFTDIVAMTAASGLSFSLVTNGWSLPKHLNALLPHRDRLRMIVFSLDGAREATHDALRGAGSFRRVLQAISVCVLRELPFGLNMTLTRDNRGEIEAMAALGAGLGALGVRFGHLMNDPNPAAAGLELTPAERKSLGAELAALQARSKLPVAIAPGGYTEALFPCSPLQETEYNLDWRGRLGLCCHLSGFAGEEAALGGDLNRLGLGAALARLRDVRQTLKAEKLSRSVTASWRDDDRFPCWYCSKRFGAADWIRAWPEHPWHETFILESAV